jgi:hypothetical protein
MENAARLYAQLMALGPLQHVDDGDALKRIGLLVDLAGDLDQPEGTLRAMEWSDEFRARKPRPEHEALLEYFIANAWHNRQQERHHDVAAAWDWEQPELLRQIFHLRVAIGLPGFDKLSRTRRCQILTNLANQLSTLGRFVEARATWTRALAIDPRFGMARGNRGSGLIKYARSHYDENQAVILLAAAHEDLAAALGTHVRYNGEEQHAAKDHFAAQLAQVERWIEADRVKREIKLDGYSLGRSAAERSYRRWVLREGLFLNPLNDLGPLSVAASDILSLPSYTTPLKEPPTLIGFFNQMKQEYVSARWLLYEGLHSRGVHFSDRDVLLFNTLDYPSYALAIEKVKAAYRTVYSLLDKIAFFINDYAKLGIAPHRVYFRTLWYEDCDPQKPVRAVFNQSRNLSLRALYWLGKDLFDPALRDVMEPEARALYAIRNHLEHSYLKVHELTVPSGQETDEDDAWADRLAYSVQREDFAAKTIHVLKRARAGLIYLSFGMHREEIRRRDGKDEAPRSVPMELPVIEERWKQ